MSAGVWIGIALLGGIGAVARFVVDTVVAARTDHRIPWGIFAVNISGAFAIGVLSGAGAALDVFRLVGVGLLGAYTTFSTWMLQVEVLRRDGRTGRAWLYVLASVAGGLAAAALGRAIA